MAMSLRCIDIVWIEIDIVWIEIIWITVLKNVKNWMF